MTVRVGFLGCGLIAGFHALGLARVDEADIVSVFDVDPKRATTFATAQGADAAGSVEEVIAASDAIYITAWTSAHPELVAAVAAAGKPLFCEKPLGVDLATAQTMIDTVENATVTNQVGLVLRASPAFRWLRDQVADTATGAPMSMVFRDDQYIPIQGMYDSTWRGDPSKAGAGALLEHSIHDLDLIDWIMGPVTELNAVTARHHGIDGIEDQATVMLRTESGAHVVLSSTWHDIVSRPSQRAVEVFCADAHLRVDGDWTGPVRRQHADGRDDTTKLDHGNANPDADFIAAARGGTPAHPDFRAALRAHELVDAAYRSAAADGATVAV
jgi:myo-inositol 2-dehydrogenase / D-chiro-inositol 1-dehydrogenase